MMYYPVNPNFTALGKTWNEMEWIGMEFFHEFLKWTALFISTKLDCPLTPTPDLDPPDLDRPPDLDALTLTPKPWHPTLTSQPWARLWPRIDTPTLIQRSWTPQPWPPPPLQLDTPTLSPTPDLDPWPWPRSGFKVGSQGWGSRSWGSGRVKRYRLGVVMGQGYGSRPGSQGRVNIMGQGRNQGVKVGGKS